MSTILSGALRRLDEIDKFAAYLDSRIDEKKKVNGKHLNAHDACDELTLAADKAIQQGNIAIHGAAGLGKTSKLLEIIEAQILENEHLHAHFYVPSHRLGKELERKSSADIRVQKGRLQPGVITENTCRRSDLVKSLADRGIHNVMGLLCVAKDKETKRQVYCPYYRTCEYILQRERATQVKALPHNYLTLSQTILDTKKPDMLIIDEGFLGQFEAKAAWPIGDLIGMKSDFIKDVVNLLVSGDPILPALKERPGVRTEIQELLDDYTKVVPYIQPNMGDREITKILLETAPVRNNIPYRLLTTLRAAMDSGASDTTSIWYDSVNAKIRAAWLKPLAKHLQGIPVTLLDATMHIDLVRKIFPNVEYHEINAELNAHVTQIASTTLSNRRLEPRPKDPEAMRTKAADLKHKLEYTAGALADMYGAGLIVGKMSYMDEFTLPEGCRKAHFGAIRGIDAFKDLHWAMVIGRNQPPVLPLVNRARCYHGNDAEPLDLAAELESKWAFYHMRDNDIRDANVKSHPDARVNEFLRMSREDESVQAIHRLRLVHSKERKPIFVVSSVPLNIQVDRLVTLDEFLRKDTAMLVLAKELLRNGTVILSRDMTHCKTEKVVNFPYSWEKLMEQLLAEKLNCALVNEYILINHSAIKLGKHYTNHQRDHCLPIAVKFRLAGQRGKMSSAWTIQDEQCTRAWIEHNTGKSVSAYEALEPS